MDADLEPRGQPLPCLHLLGLWCFLSVLWYLVDRLLPSQHFGRLRLYVTKLPEHAQRLHPHGQYVRGLVLGFDG